MTCSGNSKRVRRIRGRRAFSLIELVLVLAILALLAGIAMPRYGRAADRYRADAAAKRITAELHQAQAAARAGSGPCAVSFSTTAATLQTTLPTIGGASGRVVKTDLAAPPFRAALTSASFNGSSAVTFDGYGVPSNGGSVLVTCGAERRTITLDAKTGAVTVN